MKIGLIGWNTLAGLGSQTRDLARHVADEWVLPRDKRNPSRGELRGLEPIKIPDREARTLEDTGILDRVDVIMSCERPIIRGLVEACRRKGVRTALWVNHEWLPPGGFDPPPDLYIAPTRYTQGVLASEAEPHRVACVPMGIDTNWFPFQQRGEVHSFVYVDGTGGKAQRKGAPAVAEAAWRLYREGHPAHWVVFSQRVGRRTHAGRLPKFPPTVDLMGTTDSAHKLYKFGQVCVQPSRWEGIGLQMLECQSAGLPLVTTDAPPMAEHNPIWRLPADRNRIKVARPTESHDVRPEELVKAVKALYGRDVSEESRGAREFVEWKHGWDRGLRIRSICQLLCGSLS